MAIRKKAKKDPVEVLKKEKDKASVYRDETSPGDGGEIEPNVTRGKKKEAGGKKVDPTGLSGTGRSRRRGG
ncbi:MAG: hypothetical protein HYZ11_04200 [Candidatus Tectomicrobia bacterium]|uniref:Uncharacterized protein n=1 Tax=Tectimicrobiota bacterium TaxID=2528274 RepID=A0A932HXE2_UNCTE|nr:hypothetical protein [Candidatus Tectomicrobia bacterium]